MAHTPHGPSTSINPSRRLHNENDSDRRGRAGSDWLCIQGLHWLAVLLLTLPHNQHPIDSQLSITKKKGAPLGAFLFGK